MVGEANVRAPASTDALALESLRDRAAQQRTAKSTRLTPRSCKPRPLRVRESKPPPHPPRRARPAKSTARLNSRRHHPSSRVVPPPAPDRPGRTTAGDNARTLPAGIAPPARSGGRKVVETRVSPAVQPARNGALARVWGSLFVHLLLWWRQLLGFADTDRCRLSPWQVQVRFKEESCARRFVPF
jgi:hypothetical protein